jgi:Heme exporter protein D|tara:strand:- start:825 stop:1040 length:216 start_codon:yes stop_codon:yes gene_type:complete
MASEILILGGYGHFVWPAFLFTFSVCLILYLKTIKEFKKYEKIYLIKFEQKYLVKTQISKDKKILSNDPIF